MTGAMSLYLDALRALAALAVFADHLLIGRFHGREGALNEGWNFGPDAVIVFFVLSGFVIAHTSQEKDRTAGAYAFSRMTRLYTVAVPAFLLTYAVDRIGIAIDPAAYAGDWYREASLAAHLFFAVTLSQEWAGAGVWIGTNGALWSLSFEAAYYAIFGIALHARGARRVLLLALACALAGPDVLLLLPAWLMGVGAHALLRRSRSGGRGWLLLAPLPLVVYALVGLEGHPRTPGDVSALAGGWFAGAGLGRAAQFPWDNLVALLVAAHLVLVGLGLRRAAATPRGPAARAVRAAAGHSFSLYAVHLPLMNLGWCLFAPVATGPGRIALIALFALAGAVLFARAFEAPLPRHRAMARRLLGAAAGAVRLRAG